jgi:recombination protein RecR
LTAAFDKLRQTLRKLPGLGHRSAERIALHLLVEDPQKLGELVAALGEAASRVARCPFCGNIADKDENGAALPCEVCANPSRDAGLVCVVEHVPDLVALEKSAAHRGVYHVLHGRLSPVHGIGPAQLNLQSLRERIEAGGVRELILALSNDIEGEATCHYIQTQLAAGRVEKVSRIGFGLPSGAGIGFADAVTLKSALEGRRGL